MPVDTLSRKEIDQFEAFAAHGGTDADGRWFRLDFGPKAVGVLRHALDEPTRLASARAEGVREGIEMAAKWHEARAAEHSRYATREASGQWTNGPALSEDAHRRYAETLRALSPPPAEPTGMTAEPDICRSCDGSGEGVADTTCNRCNGSGAEPSTPVAPDWPTRCAALEADGIAARKRAVALEAENAKLREGLKDTTAHLVAAHSLLGRTPRAKMAAASNTMFDQMLRDYEAAADRGRALLQGGPDAG